MANCKIYMVDHSNVLFDLFKKFEFARFGSKALPDPDPTSRELIGCLYIVHTDAHRSKWLRKADSETTREFLFISRNVPGSLPDDNDLNGRNNCHISHIRADELPTNNKFAQFIEGARNGKFNWELLLQEPYPEYLLAAYLLDMAMTIPDDDELKTRLKQSRDDIWGDIEEKAKKEFKDHGGQVCDWSDIERRMAEVKKIFSRVGEQRTG